MPLGITDYTYYDQIAKAIQSKAGTQSTYSPSQMAGAIMELSMPTIASVSFSANGLYTADGVDADAWSKVRVSVPNTYSAADVGKVVSGQSLVGQTSLEITESGTYSTTFIKTVNVIMHDNPSYDDFVCRTLSGLVSGSQSLIGSYAFAYMSITDVSFPLVTTIGSYAFDNCNYLTKASFPECTTVGGYAFRNTSAMSYVSFPKLTSIGAMAFAYQKTNMASMEFPLCTNIESSAFLGCYDIDTIRLPVVSRIGSNAFSSCWNLMSLYLDSVSTVPTLGNISVFYHTPMVGYSSKYGSIYVPSSLFASFRTATYWSIIASSRFVSV